MKGESSGIVCMLAVAALAGVGVAAPAAAQKAADATDLTCGVVGSDIVCEEVVVTRKRVEGIDEVPVSVTLVPGSAIRDWGYYDVFGLSSAVTNLHYSANVGPSDNVVMRGLGTVGAGPQFEPAVGQLFNGVFLSRSRFGRVPWFDLRQVEVFRGPQGAVIGKNHSLGAVSAYPNRPSDVFEGSLFGSYDFEEGPGFETEAVLSGPLSDRFRARLALNRKDRDGWYSNEASGVSAPERDDLAVRLMFDADLSENASMELLWQRLDINHLGKPREVAYCSRESVLQEAHPEYGDCTGDARHRSMEAIAGGEPWETEVDLGTLKFTRLFSRHSLDIVAGTMRYTMHDVVDADLDPDTGVAAPFRYPLSNQNTLDNVEEFDQQSIEVRISSVTDSEGGYLAGLHYLRYGIDYWQDHNIANIRPPFFPNGTKRRIFADVDDSSLGVFADYTKRFSPKLSLNVGVRALTESKSAEASRRAYAIDAGNAPVTLSMQRALNARAGSPCQARRGFVLCSDVGDDRRDRAVSYNANLRWWPRADETMLFASIATGYKSGGFNLTADLQEAQLRANDNARFNFDPENSTGIEAGGRHAVTPNLNFDWTLFYTRVDDLQVSSFQPGSITHAVNNAGSAHSRGLEIYARHVGERLAASLSASFTDAVYRSFAEAPCFPTVDAAGTALCVTEAGRRPGTQDLSGRRLARAPRTQAVADFRYVFPAGGDKRLSVLGKLVWVGRHHVDTELAPLPEAEQDAYSKIDFGIELGSASDSWHIAVLGRNLGDARTLNFFNEIGLLNPYVGPGSAFGFAEIGRTVALKVFYRFGQ